ncbi:hypothetical protein FRC02_001030 [Tulasnella sp. 418]|nr:hypothetical protein FRC02_001030 [Tulasnella sp. 418]
MTIAQMVEHKLMKRVRLLGEGFSSQWSRARYVVEGSWHWPARCSQVLWGPQAALVKTFVGEEKEVKVLIDDRALAQNLITHPFFQFSAHCHLPFVLFVS